MHKAMRTQAAAAVSLLVLCAVTSWAPADSAEISKRSADEELEILLQSIRRHHDGGEDDGWRRGMEEGWVAIPENKVSVL